jgi:cell division protein FtsI/penicillin-binding protein 2
LGNVNGKLDTVVAESAAGGSSIDRGTAVAAKNTEEAQVSIAPKRQNECGVVKEDQDSRSSALLLSGRGYRDRLVIQIHRHVGQRCRVKFEGVVWVEMNDVQ